MSFSSVTAANGINKANMREYGVHTQYTGTHTHFHSQWQKQFPCISTDILHLIASIAVKPKKHRCEKWRKRPNRKETKKKNRKKQNDNEWFTVKTRFVGKMCTQMVFPLHFYEHNYIFVDLFLEIFNIQITNSKRTCIAHVMNRQLNLD